MVIKLEKELDSIEEAVINMGKKTKATHEKVLIILKQADKSIALDIIQNDDIINHLEEEVNDLAISALALLSPVASDLRRVVAAIKIASDLERIADYAKNTAIFLIKHEQVDETILDYALNMEQAFLYMLDDAMEAYAQKDVTSALEIPAQDQLIDELTTELSHKLYALENIEQLKHALEVASILRSMERSGDHTKNICEHIIYLVKGQHYDFG